MIHNDNDRFLMGRSAIVTGAGSGIGLAIAHRFAEAGARVIVVDRDDLAAREVASQIDGDAVAIDLSDSEAIATQHFEADILVNNAGMQHVAPLTEFAPDTFALMQRLMVEAPFRLTQKVLPGMYRNKWGRLIHMSSVHGHRASAFKSAYVTAKHALEGLSKTIALEGAPHGVTSNTIAPGYVRTPLVEGQIASQAQAHGMPEAEVLQNVLLSRTPLGRLIEPEEVAAAVLFMCSPACDSMTGTSLHLDGGWTAA